VECAGLYTVSYTYFRPKAHAIKSVRRLPSAYTCIFFFVRGVIWCHSDLPLMATVVVCLLKSDPNPTSFFSLTFKFDTHIRFTQFIPHVNHKSSPVPSRPLCLTPQPPLSMKTACLRLRRSLSLRLQNSRYIFIYLLFSLSDYLLGLCRQSCVLHYG
jgi:hypothetical protein